MGLIQRTRLVVLHVCWLLLVLHLAVCDSSIFSDDSAFSRLCPNDRVQENTLPVPVSCAQCQACARTCPVEDTAETAPAVPAVPNTVWIPPQALARADLQTGGFQPALTVSRSTHISSLTSAPNAPPAARG